MESVDVTHIEKIKLNHGDIRVRNVLAKSRLNIIVNIRELKHSSLLVFRLQTRSP